MAQTILLFFSCITFSPSARINNFSKNQMELHKNLTRFVRERKEKTCELLVCYESFSIHPSTRESVKMLAVHRYVWSNDSYDSYVIRTYMSVYRIAGLFVRSRLSWVMSPWSWIRLCARESSHNLASHEFVGSPIIIFSHVVWRLSVPRQAGRPLGRLVPYGRGSGTRRSI